MWVYFLTCHHVFFFFYFSFFLLVDLTGTGWHQLCETGSLQEHHINSAFY